ncbi:hypothetical protein Aasi_0209 [Candidatus Amoebophilus asiaticus 5a2]|uniref:Transposase n=1 Tax=Amoebophilus asiaticus (strain 5a2) TaxID=452471 RepID=B3ER01_AMOA5|nr:hypothetical protein Aasi_0209 [Candidatus Amoebophilus asiaticus 5a2]
MSIFKRRHFKYDIIIWAVRWYCKYGISYHDLEEMLSERGIQVDHCTIYRWVQFYAPKILDKLKWYWKPTRGYSWLTKATYQVNRTNLVIFQYREVRKDKNVPKDKLLYQKDAENKVATYNNRKYKTQFKQQLNKFIDLHSEIQASTYNFLKELTWGYGIAQSITYKLKRASFTGQIAWFDTDSDNRLYLHEKSSLHSKAIPSVNKKGIKYYMLVTYKPTPNWRIEAKYSITWHLEETSIGSGQEEIDGNTKNTVSLQLIYRF